MSKTRRHGRDGRATTFRIAPLRDGLKPFKLHWFPTLGSTNTHAARMRREKRLLAPAVVLTGRQTAGRGRGANVWHAPPGVITVTYVLRAHDTLPPQHVPLICGLAVHAALTEIGLSGVGIKWPNDLWHDGRKLGGLLCERIDGIDLIGVGLNANADRRLFLGPSHVATISAHALLGRPVDQTDLVARIARHLAAALDDARTSLAASLAHLRSLDVLCGLSVRVSAAGEGDTDGIADGIDSDGRLRLRTASGVVRVINGSVRPRG